MFAIIFLILDLTDGIFTLSSTLFAKAYVNNALASFLGIPLSQKTNAFQQNNNILLTDKSTINSKPQLEIFADDVKCSHGCTIGQLDQDALFYLRARGIPKKEAKALLTFAFANNVLESVNIPSVKSRIKKIIANKLGVDLGFDL